jgi:lipopolysaccharide transport system ATP-binding protein
MSEVILRVENLGKKYRLQHKAQQQRYVAIRDIFAEKMKRLFRKVDFELNNQKSVEDFWALKDVSFEVNQGDVLGIIGRNGAGKSTLLKVLSRITEPTEGLIKIKGRVASLLEVGTGFHPELTGRENIFLNGAILGMTKVEIRKKFDEIVEFSEIERFLDTPVKKYSSGMYVRLAFAVAAHLDPEILIVDEVLAVGDAEFQKKCLGKMQEVSTSLGRTVLFVSHNLSVVQKLCGRGIVLDNGRVQYNGKVADALVAYSNLSTKKSTVIKSKSDRPSILRVSVDEPQACAGNFKLDVEFLSPWPLDPVLIGAVVHNQLGMPVFGFNTWMDSHLRPQCASHGVATLNIPNLALHSGVYNVAVYLGEKTQNYDVMENAVAFNFVSAESLPAGLSTESIGAMRVNGAWQIATIE